MNPVKKIITLETWRCKVYVTNDWSVYQKWAKRYKLAESLEESDYAGIHIFNDKGCSFVGVFDNTLNTLVHEMAHASLRIGEYVGMGNLYNSQEQFTYLIGHLVEKAEPLLKRG